MEGRCNRKRTFCSQHTLKFDFAFVILALVVQMSVYVSRLAILVVAAALFWGVESLVFQEAELRQVMLTAVKALLTACV